MAWRAARSLTVLHAQLKAGAPRAKPPATGVDEWGIIGDVLHDPTSDHCPHDFPGWGNDIVTACDFPNRPDLGLDAHRVLDDIRKSHDPRVKYGISNGQMFSSYATSSYAAWTWRPYNPKNGDKHFTHGHLSVVGDARADGSQFWQTIGNQATSGQGNQEDHEMTYINGQVPTEGCYADVPGDKPYNVNVGRVQEGVDSKPAWLHFVNDTFADGEVTNNIYGLRILYTKGDNVYQALSFAGVQENRAGGVVVFKKGVDGWVELPAGTRALSIMRAKLAEDSPAYKGPLGFAIER